MKWLKKLWAWLMWLPYHRQNKRLLEEYKQKQEEALSRQNVKVETAKKVQVEVTKRTNLAPDPLLLNTSEPTKEQLEAYNKQRAAIEQHPELVKELK